MASTIEHHIGATPVVKIPPVEGPSAEVADFFANTLYPQIARGWDDETRWRDEEGGPVEDLPPDAPPSTFNCGNSVVVACVALEHVFRSQKRWFEIGVGQLIVAAAVGRMELTMPGAHAWVEERDPEVPEEIVRLYYDPTADQAVYLPDVRLPEFITADMTTLLGVGLNYSGTDHLTHQGYVEFMLKYHPNFLRRVIRTGRYVVEAGICPPLWDPDYTPRPSVSQGIGRQRQVVDRATTIGQPC